MADAGLPCEGDLYDAPHGGSMTVEPGPDEDLTITGASYDSDDVGPSDTLFGAERTVPAEDIYEDTAGEWLAVPGDF